jgi:hypothetical protein
MTRLVAGAERQGLVGRADPDDRRWPGSSDRERAEDPVEGRARRVARLENDLRQLAREFKRLAQALEPWRWRGLVRDLHGVDLEAPLPVKEKLKVSTALGARFARRRGNDLVAFADRSP